MSKVSTASLESFINYYATPRLEYLAQPLIKEAYAKAIPLLKPLFTGFAKKNPKAYTTLVDAATAGKNFKQESVVKAIHALRDFAHSTARVDSRTMNAVREATNGKYSVDDVLHTLVGLADDGRTAPILNVLKNKGLLNPITSVETTLARPIKDVKLNFGSTADDVAKAVKPGSGGSSLLNWYHEHPIAAAASIAAGGAGVGGTVGGLVGHSSGRSSGLHDGMQQGMTEALRWHLQQTSIARQRYMAQQNSFWNRLMNVISPTDVDSILPISLPDIPGIAKAASSRYPMLESYLKKTTDLAEDVGLTKQAGKLKNIIDFIRKSKIYQTSANTIPGQYAKHALGSLIWGRHGAGNMVRGLGRRLGANGVYDVNTGAWTYVDPGNVTGVFNKLRNALAKGGQRMIEQGARASKPWKSRLEALEQGGHKVQANLLRYGAPVTGLAAVYGPSMVLDEDNPLTWPMKPIQWGLEYGNPIGLAATGIMALGDTYTSMKQEAERAALDAAESAAKQTIEESAKALSQQGIMSYLGGAFSPETFAKTFYNQGMERTDEIMKTLRMLQENGEDLSKLLKSGQPT